MNTRVLLLPPDAADPVRCLAVDGEGRVVEALEVPVGEPVPAGFAGAAPRTVLVVPGEEIGTWHTELPTRDAAQALAAARLALADRVAEPADALHIAIGPLQPGQPRLLCWVKPARLRQWLERVQALGVQVDSVVPDYLALPAPADGMILAIYQGRWLARGQTLAFSAEPDLARQVIGERPVQWIAQDQVESCLAAGAGQAPINLLQYQFQPRRGGRAQAPSWRRLALLAGLVLVSPVLLLLVDAARYRLVARSLEARAAALAAPHLRPGASGDPAAGLAAELALRKGPASAAALRQALFDALAATPGTRLESLDSSVAAGLQATIVHRTPEQLEQLRAALLARGHATTFAPLEPGGDGQRSRLQAEPAR